MTSLLFLSTRDGNSDETWRTFWNIGLPRLNTLGNYRVSLQNIEFPNTVYPINTYNNKVYFNEGAGNLTATLGSNVYTLSEMATELQTQMNSAGAHTYTVVADTQAKKLTITDTTVTFYFLTGANDAYEELGFDSTLFTNTLAASEVSDYPVQLSGSRYVDVITNFSTHNHSVSSTASVMVRVPLNVPFGSLVFYEPTTDDRLFITTTAINEIYMELRDDKGNSYALPRNAHVGMTLKIEQ
jgi:hypothetical protein